MIIIATLLCLPVHLSEASSEGEGDTVAVPFKAAVLTSSQKVLEEMAVLASEGFDRVVDVKGYEELTLYALRNAKCALQELPLENEVRRTHMIPVLRSIEAMEKIASEMGKTYSLGDSDEASVAKHAAVAQSAGNALNDGPTEIVMDVAPPFPRGRLYAHDPTRQREANPRRRFWYLGNRSR